MKKTKKKNGLIGAIATAVVVIAALVCVWRCVEKIPVGYEAVVYNINGGVSGETLDTGWHVVSPMKKVKNFTISNEQIILSKDSREGSEGTTPLKSPRLMMRCWRLVSRCPTDSIRKRLLIHIRSSKEWMERQS